VARRLRAHWLWLPLPIVAAYLAAMAVNFNWLVGFVYRNADLASAPVIGQLFGGSPAHRQAVLGQTGWYSTLLFELATRWLPSHRQLWEVVPYAMLLTSAALMAWGAWKVAGRWAAMITGTVIVCASPAALGWLLGLDDHSTTWFSMALLASLLVALYTRPSWMSPTWATTVAVVVVGAVVGVNGASDLILLVAGVVPALLAAAVVWWLRPGPESARAGVWMCAAVAAAVVADVAIKAYMQHENVVPEPGANPLAITNAAGASAHFSLWWQSVMVLGNGNFFGDNLTLTSGLQFICALLSLVTVVLVVRFALREVAAAVEPRPAEQDAARDRARLAWCVFWGSSVIVLTLVFIFSSLPIDIDATRYIVGIIYGPAALLGLMAGRVAVRRAVVTLGVSIFAFTALVSLIENQTFATSPPISYSSYGSLEQIAYRDHIAYGYADYWDAAAITWSTDYRLKVFPVQSCAGTNVCAFSLHVVSSWYQGRPGQGSFLLGQSPSPSMGKPSATYQIAGSTMYVFPYDVGKFIAP
jgi:hypothetical protein